MTGISKFTYYPGCSAQGSASHLDRSLRAVLARLGIEIDQIDDWNCCGTTVGHVAGGTLPQMALSGRNLAKARQQATSDVLTACAACYLNTHGVNEKIKNDVRTKRRVNEALAAAGLRYEGDLKVRHACEVLVNDVGVERIRRQVTNPLVGLKVAGYVGCQTVRPFAGTASGGSFDTYDRPGFLDAFIEACGAEAVDFEPKTSCCGGSVSVHSPDKTLHLIKKILESAAAAGADVITTPCPLCLQNTEMYQPAINKEFGTAFNIPIVFYSQLMAVAFGMDANKDAALDRNMIAPSKLAGLARKASG